MSVCLEINISASTTIKTHLSVSFCRYYRHFVADPGSTVIPCQKVLFYGLFFVSRNAVRTWPSWEVCRMLMIWAERKRGWVQLGLCNVWSYVWCIVRVAHDEQLFHATLFLSLFSGIVCLQVISVQHGFLCTCTCTSIVILEVLGLFIQWWCWMSG